MKRSAPFFSRHPTACPEGAGRRRCGARLPARRARPRPGPKTSSWTPSACGRSTAGPGGRDDAEAAIACGRGLRPTWHEGPTRPEMGLVRATRRRTSCSSSRPRRTSDAFVLAEVHRPFMTISPHEYHPPSAVQRRPECKERKTVAPKDGALRIPMPPPSVADAGARRDRARADYRPSSSGGPARPAGTAPSLPPRCLPGASRSGTIAGSCSAAAAGQPFVRVNAALGSVRRPVVGLGPRRPTPRAMEALGCEVASGFDVHPEVSSSRSSAGALALPGCVARWSGRRACARRSRGPFASSLQPEGFPSASGSRCVRASSLRTKPLGKMIGTVGSSALMRAIASPPGGGK